MTVFQYYRHPAVRARLAEYCGLPSGCHYLTVFRDLFEPVSAPFPAVLRPDELGRLLTLGPDIFRSVWDRGRALLLLEIEYVNFDYRGEPFVRPVPSFEKLEPAYATIVGLLRELGLDHLVVTTGQGYHFASGLPLDSDVAAEVAALGPVLPSLAARYAGGLTPTAEPVTSRAGAAYAGVGLLVEWLAHEVICRAGTSGPAPLVCFGTVVGNRGPVGREAVSLDLSAFADPLDRRYIRCAFSAYQKTRALADSIGPGIAAGTPPWSCVPRAPDEPLADTLAIRGDLARAAHRAEACSAVIPDGAAGLSRLLAAYRASALARFHTWYQEAQPDPPEAWPAGYDRLDLSALPPCVALPLSRPNHALLVPTNLQNVVRVLWAMGWHPRHVGGLMRSKYERDHGWGLLWFNYDASTRADVYTRVFAGLVAGKADDLRDFNCLSHQEKGYCPRPFCGHSLGDYQVALRSRLP